MNIGGSFEMNGVTVTMTQAFHSAEVGVPTGFIIQFPGGANIYHAGDTGIFNSMKILGKLYALHVALLPIGGVFTMDPRQAAMAVARLKPSKAIPMHFGTFPILELNADRFVLLASAEAPDTEVVVLEPGNSFTLE